MKFIHVKNIEKYHPGYKDRKLLWAKVYFDMVHGDPDCEMITNEIDWGRLIRLIILELKAQKPIPVDNWYLTKNGFDIKKRPIELTLDMLHNFVDVVTEDSKVCVVEKRREREEKEKSRGEERNKDYASFEVACLKTWNDLVGRYPSLSRIKEITGTRRSKLKKRFEVASFREGFVEMVRSIPGQPFLLGKNERGWTVSFDWLIENDTNYIKVSENKYRHSQKDKEDEADEVRKRLNL